VGTRTTPGQTALTRMGASSTASARVSDSTAPQMLAATAPSGTGAAAGDAGGQGDRAAGLQVRRGGVHGPQRAEVPQGEELPGFVQVQGGQVHQRQRLACSEHEVVDVAQVADQAADQGRVGEVGRPRAGAKR
jgi:hypothetical protein